MQSSIAQLADNCLFSKRLGYRLSKQSKVVQVFVTDVINDFPINGLVVVHRDISEANRLLHLIGQIRLDDLQAGKHIEGLRHSARRRNIGIGDNVRRDIHAKLHSSG